jgi:hypothetical protein
MSQGMSVIKLAQPGGLCDALIAEVFLGVHSRCHRPPIQPFQRAPHKIHCKPSERETKFDGGSRVRTHYIHQMTILGAILIVIVILMLLGRI